MKTERSPIIFELYKMNGKDGQDSIYRPSYYTVIGVGKLDAGHEIEKLQGIIL